MPEPKRLARGKEFHRRIQAEWHHEAEGLITDEKQIIKPSGRKGRIDIHVDADEGLVAVVEIKNSDWDKMASHRVRPNAKRYCRQIWNYIDAELKGAESVSPGIIFPKRPTTQGRLNLVEELFDEEGIPVVWYDESFEELRIRMKASGSG